MSKTSMNKKTSRQVKQQGDSMDLKYIKQLLELVENSTVNEIEVEEKGQKVRITKTPSVSGYHMQAMPHQVMMPAPVQVPSVPASVSTETQPVPDAKQYHEIKSPIVGTFYRAPSPESPAYVDVGNSVKQGSVLCIVEAMKLMNEIESDVSGTVAKVMVENGKPVEYGQVLFLIEK
jgi:acetyl-CoA carboxylase biotin carboxyl carrier protein